MKTYLLAVATLLTGFSFGQIQPTGNSPSPSNQGTNQNYSVKQTSINTIGGSQITPAGQHVCRSHELNEAHYQSRGILQQFNQDYLQGASNAENASLLETSGTNEISIIFHVVYNNASENVSNAAIMNVYNDLVEDFLLLNSDAANARTGAPFNYVPANPNINFCLATQDPSGNPLPEVGVTRTFTNEVWYDSNNGEENKMKSSATGGADIWNRNNYLNVWICDISNGATSGVAGYAYRPTTSYLPSASIDGIVIDYNLGVNNDNILTHEVGHYLGLDHTWGGSGGCGNDDGFNDTPITAGPSSSYPGSCGGTQQTCSGTYTQYENYMDYSNCTVMFTQAQANYMLTILQGIRSSLLLSPGCDPTNTPPNSAFTSLPAGPSPVVIPVNGSVDFFDASTNVPTGWNWTISGTQGTDWNYIGGTSGTSQDPQVEFYTPGLYDISLAASNSYGTDATPASEIGYVQVVSPATGTACDTLRNYHVDSSWFIYGAGTTNGAWGVIPSHNAIDLYGNGSSVENTLQYAEYFNYTGTAEVRRIRLPIFQADAGTPGTVEFRIYQNGTSAPGTVIASETVNIADLTLNAWNEIDFTTPATVTGPFWAGVELNYGTPQDTVLMVLTDSDPSGTSGFHMEMDTYGWLDATLLGITESLVMDVLLSNGPAPVASYTISDTLLCDGGSVTVNGSGSTNVTNYYWYLTDDPVTTIIDESGAPSNTYSPMTAGDYLVFLFADGSCMTDAATAQSITVNPTISATVTPTGTTCGNNNGQIDITGVTGGDPATYEYSLDGINYVSTSTFTGLPSGTYDVYVRSEGDNCEAVYSVTVNSSTSFTAGVSANSSVCPGGSATITASGGTTYQWFDGATSIAATASTTVTPAATTQYSCVVTDGAGCQSTVFTTVSLYNAPTTPTISASGSTTICSGTSVDLTSSYPTGNSWSTAETSSTITVNSSGSYSVTYTDGNGCTSTSAPTVVTVVASPTISSGAGTSDPTACASSTGSIQVSGSGSGDISWTGTTTGNPTGITLPYTINSLPAGSYNVTFTDGNGCTSNLLSVALNDPTPPATPTVSTSGATTFCNGGNVVLTSSYGSGNSWSNAATTNSITVTSSGSYSVTYTDGSGCSSTSAPVVVTVNPTPTSPTITPSGALTFCDGGSVDLSSSQGSGNAWSNSATSQTITVTTSGTYDVTYTDGNGCSATSSPITVTVNANPTPPTISTSGSTTICQGQTVDLTSSQATGNEWSTTETTATITVSTAGSYSVIYTDANGCSATSAPTTVSVNALPTVDGGSDQTVCEGDMVTLSGSGASTYAWDNGITDGTAFTPSVGTTTYTVTGTDANGCTNTDQVDVIVNALPTVTISPLSTVCDYTPAITLAGGSPAGGTYSGTGVTGTTFDPATAGLGTHTITYSYTDANGCTNTSSTDILVDGCASIDETTITGLEIYPNPVEDVLTIELKGEFDIIINDARGRIVGTFNSKDQLNVDTQNFESGVYLLTITNEFGQTVHRIIKR